MEKVEFQLELIKRLGADLELADSLLKSLNQAAIDIDSYEYGLPIHSDGDVDRMRSCVLRWLIGFVLENEN